MPRRNLRALSASAITPVELHILLALVDADRHGYAIMQQVALDSDDAIRLGPGTLYGAIKRLLDRGSIREVESRVDPDLDDARRRYYRLTPSGRAAVVEETGRLAALVKLAQSRRIINVPAGARGGRP